MKRTGIAVVCVLAFAAGWLGSFSRGAVVPAAEPKDAGKDVGNVAVFDNVVVKRLVVVDSDHRTSVVLKPGGLALAAPGTDIFSNVDKSGVVKSTAMLAWREDKSCAFVVWDGNGKARVQLGTTPAQNPILFLMGAKSGPSIMASVDPQVPGGKGVSLIVSPQDGSAPWEAP